MENKNMIAQKTQRNFLSLEDKVECLRRVDSKEPYKSIRESFNISRATLMRIVQQREKIMNLSGSLEEGCPKLKRKRIKNIEDPLAMKILFDWYMQNRTAGVPISGPCLQGVAVEVYRSFGDENFKASNGWLETFHKRFGIRQMSQSQDERVPVDPEGSESFCSYLKQFIEEERFDFEHIYNADETGLQWKVVPNKTLASWKEEKIPGCESCKERITFMVCANAAGTHQIPLLVIGKEKSPNCFRTIDCLPLYYTYQKKALMDRDIFFQWYRDIFIPSLKKRMRTENEKFLLLLDNSPSHPSIEELYAVDSCCVVKHIPSNAASSIQPMDQGIISIFKTFYKRLFLQEVLLLKLLNPVNSFAKFLNEWTLIHCMRTASTAWESVTSENLRNAWGKLLNLQTQAIPENIAEIPDLATRAFGQPFSEQETIEWLNIDKHDCGWEIQTIQQIVSRYTQFAEEQEQIKEEQAERENDEEDEVDLQEQANKASIKSIRAKTAVQAASELYDWLMTRSDVELQQLAVVGLMRQMAVDVMLEEN